MTPDKAFTAYFAVFCQAASPGSIIIGQPQGAESPTSADARHVKLADLALLTRDLEPAEWDVIKLRFMAASGVTSYRRYVRTVSDLPLDEQPTGQRHPDDDELHEVVGTMTRAPNYREIGKRLGTSSHQVSCHLARARRKVRDRLRVFHDAERAA